MSYDEISPETALLATMERHRIAVRRALQRVIHELDRRALVHDESKYTADELPGFVRINRVAREHPYGSEEYRASLKGEMCTAIHQKHNSHHPESHIGGYEELSESARSNPMTVAQDACENVGPWRMGWLDIVEMVCDWWAATQTYGTTPWEDVLRRQKERWNWTGSQWWLIRQVADWLDGAS